MKKVIGVLIVTVFATLFVSCGSKNKVEEAARAKADSIAKADSAAKANSEEKWCYSLKKNEMVKCPPGYNHGDTIRDK